jgi:hypothetical protein
MEDERNRNENSDSMRTKEGYDLGTFDFLRTGWFYPFPLILPHGYATAHQHK